MCHWIQLSINHFIGYNLGIMAIENVFISLSETCNYQLNISISNTYTYLLRTFK